MKNNHQETVTMTQGQMLDIACAEIMEQVKYFENKEFNPTTAEECKKHFFRAHRKKMDQLGLG